ncbi:STAS domain-containing protein [uncultured Abyssibacter sp.]|uniref:STAS domain-containing protein n=1 Tax=uncultured Abyssibacter sp. TaxID=2320202 RepID=UPI0032B27301
MASKSAFAGGVKLTGDLTIERVKQARDDLITQCPKAGGAQVDLAGVEAIDLAGVQLLVSVYRALMDETQPVFVNVPDSVTAVVDSLGLDVPLFDSRDGAAS